jgi:hypothetical protein
LLALLLLLLLLLMLLLLLLLPRSCALRPCTRFRRSFPLCPLLLGELLGFGEHRRHLLVIGIKFGSLFKSCKRTIHVS